MSELGANQALAPDEARRTEISVDELYRELQRPNDLFILDVRNQDEFETWRIESRYPLETVNIPYFEFFEETDAALARVPKDPGREIIVVCAKGGASDFVAAMLEEQGLTAVNLADGMEAWGIYHVFQTVVEHEEYAVVQVNRVARGCLSYVLISQGEAAIIDPLRHIDQYLSFLEQRNVSLRLLLDTHAHADHISGGPALATATGAPYYLHPYDGIHPFDMLPAKIDYQMLQDGQTFDLGHLQIRTIHVPGHTLGQVNFLVEAPDGRKFFFAGDNIFIDSFGRPDLGGQGERWAPMVYETIFERVKQEVPGDALVLPGHYASQREANSDGLFMKTLNDLWQENSGLNFADREEFIEFVLSHLPTMPPEYVEIKRVNIGLSLPDAEEASVLELGKNICAVASASQEE
jgi:glyoxylase-like metal-dependent hydrolase (beta-lactamase superfamily II)/rhodanese-related sulfurtransferase